MFSGTNPLVFLHIPRTGGTSLISYLDAQFSDVEICPAHEQFEFEQLHARQPQLNYSFFRGHFGINFQNVLSAKGTWITFLRKPEQRIYSTWMHLRHQPTPFADWSENTHVKRIQSDLQKAKSSSFAEFCARILDEGRLSFFNQMTVLLGLGRGWNLSPDFRPVPDDEMLENAKRTLDQMAFVGLNEDFDLSCEALQKILGRPTEVLPRLNAAKEPSNSGSIADFEQLHELTRFDTELYGYGRKLFSQRISRNANR
jgi:hypothetical protein